MAFDDSDADTVFPELAVEDKANDDARGLDTSPNATLLPLDALSNGTTRQGENTGASSAEGVWKAEAVWNALSPPPPNGWKALVGPANEANPQGRARMG